ncbi:long-chain-fatty-acid--CoA ligase [Enhydrobacter sp.]|jgi:long-chain acyl-CoA synthetase|uniref:long-chain-fatty-acid--CoA ligase n=1 Tax=Enhydrobacter sp. TaxID=1894999 RepID=UPI002634F82B|nr:long-chain-fatty-acid--CoA ligase [Enhydrobacter sp.]WIM14365.1 MAG: Long-chain-fatty-acid--CoA ligase [Enhydrobacter sp.]
MDRFWLKEYPPGVPAEIDPSVYPSLVALIEESFAKHRDARAYVCLGTALTFGEVDALSKALAAWLQSRGLRKGARVAIMMPNVLQYPVAVTAVLRAGFITVNVNPLYTARELQHQLGDSGAEAVIVLDNFAATLQAALAAGDTAVKHVVVGRMGDLLGFPKGLLVNFAVRTLRKLVPTYALPGHVAFGQAIAAGKAMLFVRPELGPDDVAVLQYTGGTTGIAKGATLLHRTIVANLLASEAWMRPGLGRKKLTGQFTIVCALPLYHVFAFVACGLLGMRTGALNILIPDPRDLAGTVKTLAKYRINIFPGVNTLFNALANRADFAKLDFSGLAITNGGGMAVQEAVAQKWLAVTGCPIVEGYGLSETAAGVTCNPTDSEAYTGTIGLPMPSVEIRILDDQGQEVPLGAPGEIAIRGPQVMQGYWRRPDETAKVMTADGFFKSGDIGVMDQRGYVKIVDRKKDMIVVSGFKVYPNEIEAVVSGHPGVAECAAVGVPDARSGEAVMLFVVKRDPKLTREALEAFCEREFTGYKRPKYIEFRNELPKSNIGKILRRELRDAMVKKAARRTVVE